MNQQQHNQQQATKPLSVIQIIDESHRNQINTPIIATHSSPNNSSSGKLLGLFKSKQPTASSPPQQQPSVGTAVTSGNNVLPSDDRAATLSYAEISQYFQIPLHEAVVQLRVDETSLKKRCRQLGISRWPYRKRVNLLKETNGDQMDTSEGGESSSSSSTGTNTKKKLANGFFRCFQVLKKKKEPKKTPKMSDEEHFFKQVMMQQEYNANLEPISLEAGKGNGLSRTKRLEYWRSQNQDFQLKQQQYIERNSPHQEMQQNKQQTSMQMNQKPMQLHNQFQSPTQEQYMNKYSGKMQGYQPNDNSPSYNRQSTYQYPCKSESSYSPMPMSPPVPPYQEYQHNQYQPHFGNTMDNSHYHHQQQYQQQQQQVSSQVLPSMGEFLAGVERVSFPTNDLNAKKRARRESADQSMQEQFATPFKRFHPSYSPPSNNNYSLNNVITQSPVLPSPFTPIQHNNNNNWNPQGLSMEQKPFRF